MTTMFADTQGHALGLNARSEATTHRSQWAVLTAGLFAGLLLIGALIVTVAPMVDLKAPTATAVGTTLSDYRLGEIGAGSVAISSATALRAVRAEEIALGSVPAPDSAVRFERAHHMPLSLTAATTPLADQGYRDQRIGEFGGASGGASGTSPERSSGK